MDENDVLALLDELSDFIEDSKPVLGNSQRRQVDLSVALDMINDIRDAFPVEFSQARQVAREREAILEEAEIERERILEDARNQALTISSEQEIVRIAQQQAEHILADAREHERIIRAGAEDYADNIFSNIETTFNALYDNVRKCRDRLNNRASV
jgi:cell division septum initiation protein DivIVA